MVSPENPSDRVYLTRYEHFCPPVSGIIKRRRLHFFGHVVCSDSRQDHHQAVSASLRPPIDWRRPRGHPHATWLRGTDANVQSANIGIHPAWRKANIRVLLQHIIDMATLRSGHATEEKNLVAIGAVVVLPSSRDPVYSGPIC